MRHACVGGVRCVMRVWVECGARGGIIASCEPDHFVMRVWVECDASCVCGWSVVRVAEL